jgi:hypothetical protein
MRTILLSKDGKDPRISLLRCARPGRNAWLLWRANKGEARPRKLLRLWARRTPELVELELTQIQMAQMPMLRAEVYARALRASQHVKRDDATSEKLDVNFYDELTGG